MSRPQQFALAALALIRFAGGASSPQGDDVLHPRRLVAELASHAAM